MSWSPLPPDEIERRRKLSIAAMAVRDNERFARWYQEKCDRLYWTTGQCCAGCDFWASSGGYSGTCAAAGIVSGADVLKSMGITYCSYMPEPGFPHTGNTFWCGKFQDLFDWSKLDDLYLKRIGAMANGKLKSKPQHKSPFGKVWPDDWT